MFRHILLKITGFMIFNISHDISQTQISMGFFCDFHV